MGRVNFRAIEERTQRFARGARVWLRRVMPRVALAALVLLAARLVLNKTFVYGDNMLGRSLEILTLLVVCWTIVYYGLRGLVWLKRKLLWKVRRRLVITYLFIGLTPIILLSLLGLLSGLVGTAQVMSRIVAVQVSATERQALANAQALADALARLPATTGERAVQSWLDERTALLQASLPGARVAVWRAESGGEAGGEWGALGEGQAAQFASEFVDENTRGGGNDRTATGAPLPEWLRNRREWSGFAFMPAENPSEPFGTPSVRALVRREVGGQRLAVLVAVPLNRALVRQFRENAGFNLHLYFLDNGEVQARVGGTNDVQVGRQTTNGTAAESEARANAGEARAKSSYEGDRDQFGDPMAGKRYLVVLPATNWLSGETDSHLSFILNFTLAEAGQQLLGNSELGQALRRAMLLLAGVFLFLELLALLSAAWMTRAVTGTVHKLYRATEFIKRGDFTHRVNVRSHDQLGELAAAFNDMSANIDSLLKQRVAFERLEREVEIAADVQAQLFPRSVPRLETVEIAGECRAARGVAGDYYDYIEIAKGFVAFALGDVSGKGISASLVMSNLQASLRAQTTIIAERMRIAGRASTPALVSSSSPSGLADAADADVMPCGVTGVDTECVVQNMVASINEQLCQSTEANRFATLFLALYDEQTRTLRYTNAGHNSPLLIRADGTLEQLTIGGTVVGVFDWMKYEEARVELERDAMLVIFSDGISEAQNADGEEYGEQRLAQFAVNCRKLSADEMRRAIFEEIDNWSGAQERGDDQTLVIIKATA